MAPGDGAGCAGICGRAAPVRAGRDQHRSRGCFDACAAAPRRLTQADAALREAENLFKQPGPPLPLAPLGWSSVMVKGGGSGAEAGRDYPPYYPGGS